MLDQYYQIVFNDNQTTPDDYGFRNRTDYERTSSAKDIFYALMAKLTNEQNEAAHYKFDEILTECIYEGRTCTSRGSSIPVEWAQIVSQPLPELVNFTEYVKPVLDPTAVTKTMLFSAQFKEVFDPIYGKCFMYEGNHDVTRTGMTNGLRLLMIVNQDRSTTSEVDYIPIINRAGLRMSIHHEDYAPSFDGRGVDLGAGYFTAVGITMEQVNRIGSPYGSCVDKDFASTNYYGADKNYTIDTCYYSCLQRNTVERCGCADPTMKKAAEMRWCESQEHLKCSREANSPIHINPVTDCGCHFPCWETFFTTTISTGIYPSNNYQVGVGSAEQQEKVLIQKTGKGVLPPFPTSVETGSSGPTQTVATMTPSMPNTQLSSTETLPLTSDDGSEPTDTANITTDTITESFPESTESEFSQTDSSTFTTELSTETTESATTVPESTTTESPSSTSTLPLTTTVPALCPDTVNLMSRLPPNIIITDDKYLENCKRPRFKCIDDVDHWRACWPCYYRCDCPEYNLNFTFPVSLPDTLMPCSEVGSCVWWNTNFPSVEECMAWYKRNGMLVYVYYHTLSYEVHTEEAAYTLSSMLADLGGHAGLWLGLSVISLVEGFGLIFVLFGFCICGKQLNKSYAAGQEEYLKNLRRDSVL